MRMSRRAGLLASAFSPADVPISYTGSYTDELVTMDGSPYRLLTLTSSGTLAVSAAVTADIWICGGGGSGVRGPGGGGGYAATLLNQVLQNLIVTIGAGGFVQGYTFTNGGNSSVSGDVSLSANGGHTQNSFYTQDDNNGGSGGGGGGSNTVNGGNGDGIAKTAFGSSYFPYPYCDGGGGGGYLGSRTALNRNGGAGGTNGGNGGSNSSGGTNGGAGGGHYGGAGGNVTTGGIISNGSAATGYGSGGGGGGSKSGSSNGTGGSGYQGACFIRIPI